MPEMKMNYPLLVLFSKIEIARSMIRCSARKQLLVFARFGDCIASNVMMHGLGSPRNMNAYSKLDEQRVRDLGHQIRS